MPAILAFRLKVPGTDEIKDFRAVSTSYRFHGRLWLDEELLVLEWSGVAQVQDVGTIEVRDDKLPLPLEELIVAPRSLHQAALLGGWWRPRLRIQARELTALSIVPSEEGGAVEFWIERHDRPIAAAIATQLNSAIDLGKSAIDSP